MRISQSPRFLSDVIREVQSGRAVPAAMQRGYVWTEKDVLDFCQSVSDRFPIGSIMTWSPPTSADLEAVGRTRIGPIKAGLEHPRQSLILDGQNRLATLAWMLSDDPDNETVLDLSEQERSVWQSGKKLVLDHDARGFCFVPSAEADMGLRLPARALFSDAMLILRTHWSRWDKEGFSEQDIDSMIKLWERASDGLREVQVIETNLSGASPEEAKSAFLRICKAGVPMDEKDFEAAMEWVS